MKFFKRLLRRKRLWPLAIVLLYTIFGFLILPGIVRWQAVRAIAENLGRDATIESVRFNPYLLSLSMRDFVLPDPDGGEFVSFDEFYVDFQISSLVRWAFTFKEVRLENPRVHVRIMPDGQLNYADILAHQKGLASSSDQAEGPPEEKAAIPRLLIGDIQIKGAGFMVTNLQPADVEEVVVSPVDFQISDFTTFPHREGAHSFVATDPGGGHWQWTGSFGFDPLHSQGSLEIGGTRLAELWEIARNRLEFEVTDGELGLRCDYYFAIRNDSMLAEVKDASLALDRFSIRAKGQPPELFALDSLRVDGIQLRYPQQEAVVSRIALKGSDFKAWLTQEGEVNWLSLLPQPVVASEATQAALAESTTKSESNAKIDTTAVTNTSDAGTKMMRPWALHLGQLALEDFELSFADRRKTAVKELESVLNWRSIVVDSMAYIDSTVAIKEILVTEPAVRTTLRVGPAARVAGSADTTAAAGGETPAIGDTTSVGASPAEPLPVALEIGTIQLAEGSVDLADSSLTRPFNGGLQSLNGSIRGLSTFSGVPAEVSVECSLLPSGIVRVSGQASPLNTDLYTHLDVYLSDYDLTALSPYAGEFIGHEIKRGVMMLDLNIKIEERYLVAANKIELDQLELGAGVESAAATNLPVPLAIKLLKNKRGEIDLDLPIEGDLDDPNFHPLEAVVDVLVKTVTKVVKLPFSILGTIVGIGGDGSELSYVAFEPGSSVLSAAEADKLGKLAAALAERPQIRLEVKGGILEDTDRAALQEAKLAAQAAARVAQDQKKYASPTGTDYAIHLLRDLYKENFGGEALAKLEAEHQKPVSPENGQPQGGETVLDETTFSAAAKQALIALQEVAPEELEQIATTRGLSIKEALLAGDQIAPERVDLAGSNSGAEERGGLVRLKLKITG